ncbi:AfsR/SARP family transcriptional regulator [Psychromarinibacter halotolerans]|uniref:BTAD domain-containing putative transcriptional regulator n=1 Tax=Psychromarinibacter halotolerans TaxID=1775175 RepID=A0ABV7GSE7_9RHOB|nr:BTAD domain-containing putative transcriptional regulator [Psychromarinibacter halotolerans]MDF0595097.1 BTAD domain-containing putative transcriptional regulator [Psychromarinibacter halotolerans]
MQIRLLGDVRLTAPDGSEVRIPSRRSQALLAFLVLSSGRSLLRTVVAEVLWPDSAAEQARASLRQELAVLRKALRLAGLDPIEAGKDRIRWTGAAPLADVTELERRSAAGSLGDLRQAAAICGGLFMQGFSLRSEAFMDWLEAERTRLRTLALTALQEQLRASEEAGDAGRIALAAEQLLIIDPVREAAHRSLIRAYAALGRRSDALRQFETCRAVLNRETGAVPAAETEALAARIRASDPLPEPVRTPSARDGAAVLVVHLPEIAGLDATTDPEMLAGVQAQFAALAQRTVTGLEGRLMPGVGDRIVALFTGGPEAEIRAALAGLMLTDEPLPIEGGMLRPAGGLSSGLVALDAGSGRVAGRSLQAAVQVAHRAAPGELRADLSMREVLAEDYSLTEVAGTLRVVPPDVPAARPEPAATPTRREEPQGPAAEAQWQDWRAAMRRGDLRTAASIADRTAALRAEAGEVGQVMTGVTRLFRGRVGAAEAVLTHTEALYTLPDLFGIDPGLFGRCLHAWLLCLRGAPGRAGEALRRAVSEARGAGHPETLMACLTVAALMQDTLGEAAAAESAARAAHDAAADWPDWQAFALGLLGRARDRLGDAAGAGQVSEALAVYRSSGAALGVPFFHVWLAEAHLEVGDASEALLQADEGLSHGASTGVLVVEPELLRLQALALVRQGRGGEGQAEAGFVAAMESARRAGSGLFRLRTAVSYAGHLRREGRVRDAIRRLEEGLAAVEPGGPPTADLKAAQALRQRLAMD